jgi:dolichol-phosphate mannosyltransferase
MQKTLVICSKNEEKTIAGVIQKSKKYVDRIIVVDGHSTDKTVKLAKTAGGEVVFDHRKGKGEAIRMAIEMTDNEGITIFMDADGSHEPRDIKKLVEPIEKGRADLVIASRGRGGSDELSGSVEKFIRLIGSSIITMVINLRFKSNITDSQNGFRAIKSSIAKKLGLRENSFAIEQEMLMKVLKNHYRVGEISSHEYERKFGRSRIKLNIETWRYLFSLIRDIW